jgi:hypothetical protein
MLHITGKSIKYISGRKPQNIKAYSGNKAPYIVNFGTWNKMCESLAKIAWLLTGS